MGRRLELAFGAARRDRNCAASHEAGKAGRHRRGADPSLDGRVLRD
jgi:hypothetical protein